MKTLRLLRRRRGFTLVELMVAIVIAGVVVVSAYALFSNTSRAMYEVDNLSQLNDQARFAAELIARDIRSAGSFSTPNSATDKYVNPLRLSDGKVDKGTNPLDDADYLVRGIYMTAPQNRVLGPQGLLAGGVASNPNTSSDQITLLGAFDYPFTFELSGLEEEAGQVKTAAVREGPRGTWRFIRRDPFDVRTSLLGTLSAGQVQGVVDTNKVRLMRATDRNGFMMFATIDPSATGVVYDTTDSTDEKFVFKYSGDQRFHFRDGNEQNGFEPAGSTDDGYEAALLDAYRYRVCTSPEDPTNLKLVRERIDPAEVIDVSSTLASPADCGTIGNGLVEQHVVAEHVVDFQVWFDCTPNGSLVLEELARPKGWVTPDAVGAVAAHNCMNSESLTTSTVGRADQVRVAHVRLSLHTPLERRDLPNYRFLTDSNPLTTTTNATSSTAVGALQTFDLDGDPTSAARVVTVQIDVDLPNYSGRVNR